MHLQTYDVWLELVEHGSDVLHPAPALLVIEGVDVVGADGDTFHGISDPLHGALATVTVTVTVTVTATVTQCPSVHGAIGGLALHGNIPAFKIRKKYDILADQSIGPTTRRMLALRPTSA